MIVPGSAGHTKSESAGACGRADAAETRAAIKAAEKEGRHIMLMAVSRSRNE